MVIPYTQWKGCFLRLCVAAEQSWTNDRLFREIETRLNGQVPTDKLFDCEQAAMNSARNIFVGVNIKGYVFHLSQNIWRKIQQNGLAAWYEADDEFAILMRIIAALAFVPEVDVPRAFYDVENEINNKYNNNNIDVVVDYFEDLVRLQYFR